MRRFFVGLFAVIGVVAFVGFLGIVGVTVALVKLGGKGAELPESIVLTADLSGGLADEADPDSLGKLLTGDKTTLRDVVDALTRAAGDPRVKSLYLQIGGDSLGLAKTQEVRDAIAAFRAKGKFAVAFADTFGEGGTGTRPYYLATACDEIWLQPLGEVGLTGLRSETPFLRGLLDKIGIVAEFEHRSEYKSAMNSLTETAMTAPQREEIEGVLSSVSAQINSGIAQARKLTPDKVAEVIDRAPLLDEEARTLGLVSKIGYRDQAIGEARAHADSGAKLVSLSRYLAAAGRPHASGAKIALIYGSGMITREGTGAGALSGGDEFTARALSRALDAAARDKDVRAILFRIDSPGGSATASETIWREVARARQRGKPVIVSMGDVAASGGYYIAAAADKIVAQPATLTGSIGVLGGKFVFAGLMEKLGITTDAVQHGANAGMYSLAESFSPQARERVNAELDAVYAGFKAHVAAGRHLEPAAVEAIAKGRVWSGADAKEKGLVDALGGYEVALGLAREAARLDRDAPVNVVVYPRERGLTATLLRRLRNDEDDADAASMVARGIGALRMLIAVAETAFADPGLLRMVPVGEIR
jgi:protease IV